MLTGVPEMLVDINQVTAPTEIHSLVQAGDKAYYFGEKLGAGVELWVTDGTVDGTQFLKDLVPGPQSSSGKVVETIGDLSYIVEDYTGELWVTDGTETGTTKLIDNFYGNNIVQVGELLFLPSTNLDTGNQELVVNNGTPEGTERIVLGQDVPVLEMVEFRNQLLFTTKDGIWSSGGSVETTQIVAEIEGLNGFEGLKILDDEKLYLQRHRMSPEGATAEVWILDGSEDVTRLLIEIPDDPNSEGSNVGAPPLVLANAFEGRLYFLDGARLLYEVDVTHELHTPRLVSADIRVAVEPKVIDERLYFTGSNGGLVDLYLLDAAGEVSKVEGPASADILDRHPLFHQNGVFFPEQNPAFGQSGFGSGTLFLNDNLIELSEADDGHTLTAISQRGRVSLHPLTERTLGSIASRTSGCFTFCPVDYTFLASNNESVWFRASDGDDYDLWKSDGTPEGTAKVSNVDWAHPSNQSFNNTVVGNTIVYASNSNELWGTDLRLGETFLLAAPIQGTFPLQQTEILGSVNEHVIFGSSDGNLWRSDGTAEGTAEIASAAPSTFVEAVSFDGKLYFAASDETHGEELWSTDGTREGTSMVADIFPGKQGSSIGELMAVGDTLFFSANDGVHGQEVWAINTAGNEQPIPTEPTDTQTLKHQTDMAFGQMVELADVSHSDINAVAWTFHDDNLYFHSRASRPHQRLWKTDGTRQGTIDIAELPNVSLNVRTINSSIPQLRSLEVGQQILFAAGEQSSEIWALKNIAGNATQLLEKPDTEFSLIGATDRYAFFANSDGSMWASDGTHEGTTRVANADTLAFPTGGDETCQTSAVAINDLLYFIARSDEGGEAIWVSDGTEEATFVAAKPEGPTNITSLQTINGQIVFSAIGSEGGKVWAFRPRVIGDANGDSVVGFRDFLVLATHFGSDKNPTYEQGDFNADGVVNFKDFLVFINANQRLRA